MLTWRKSRAGGGGGCPWARGRVVGKVPHDNDNDDDTYATNSRARSKNQQG